MLALPLWVSTAAAMELYGQLRGSVDFSSNDEVTTGSEDSTMAFSSNASRFGFKGDEQVSDALTATYQAETTVDLDSGGIDTVGRNTYLGLKGGFGEVRGGLHDTPYKMSTKDIFADTRADYNTIIGTIAGVTLFDRRANNSILYLSPDMSGFTFQGAYIFGINPAEDDFPQSEDPDNTGFSLAGLYSQGPFSLSAAYETLLIKDGTVIGFSADDDATAYKLGAGWNYGQGTLYFIFEGIESGVDEGDRDAFYLSADYKMNDSTTLKVAFGQADELDVDTETGATYYALGASWNLSKDTELYALYASTSNDDNLGGTLPYYTLSGVSAPVAADGGPTISSLSFGMNMKFGGKFM
jgi:predicted porin